MVKSKLRNSYTFYGLSGVYVKPTSPLSGTDFHPHFTWAFILRVSSVKRAWNLDVSYNFLLLWIKIIDE